MLYTGFGTFRIVTMDWALKQGLVRHWCWAWDGRYEIICVEGVLYARRAARA